MSLALRSLFLARSSPPLRHFPRPGHHPAGWYGHLENVPEIPADVKDSVQRYQNYREAIFRDWLPDGRC